MNLEKTQIKFAVSEQSGEIIGFVSRHAKTNKLKGVREDSKFGKKICVLSEELKGTIVPNTLYLVELKPMRSTNGYVVVSATPMLFRAKIEMIVVSKSIYQVTISFGNKIIYFDPKDGKSPSSRTCEGVINVLLERNDIEDKELVLENFSHQAAILMKCMEADGYVSG